MMAIRKPVMSRTILTLSAVLAPAAVSADVVISSSQTENMICTSGICTPSSLRAVLNVTDLESLLASGNVTVTTTGSGVQAENVEVDAPLTWSSDSALALDAYESIRVQKPIIVSGPGGIAVTTNDGGTSGTFSFGPSGYTTFPATSNSLSINGSKYALVTTLPALVSAIAVNPSGTYALAASYNAAHDGTYNVAAIPTAFEGTFNGLGNRIANLKIKGIAQEKDYGLFSELDTPANLSSLRMDNVSIKAGATSLVGGIAGLSYGTVYNSVVSGAVYAERTSGGAYGGAVGFNGGTINDLESNVLIDLGPGQSDQVAAGGLVGANSQGTVKGSFSTGSVTVTGVAQEAEIGGLIGLNDGDAETCYATGSSSAEGASGYAIVGGLIGLNSLNLSSSYSAGAPTAAGSHNYIGGLIGYDESKELGGSIKNTYWDTTTSGITNLSQGAGNIANDHDHGDDNNAAAIRATKRICSENLGGGFKYQRGAALPNRQPSAEVGHAADTAQATPGRTKRH
jgi:hypothetical protein